MAENITWIIDSSIAERLVYHHNIIDEVRRQGLNCIEVAYKLGEEVPAIESQGCTVLYGSHQFVKAVNPTGKHQPGHLGVNDKIQAASYMSNLPLDWFMNRDSSFMTWAMFKYHSQKYFEDLHGNAGVFIRPNSGFKTFAGQVLKFADWDESIKTLDELSSVMPETMIMVSPLQDIQGEFRFVIADKKVIAGSEYRWDGRLDIRRDWPAECEELAQRVADLDWQVDIAYTCDVALTPAGPKIIELNGFSCAGLYACDLSKVVEGVSRAAYREWAGLDLD